VYEDNSNRSLILHVDTSKEQDQRIMNHQKQLASGKIDKKQQNDLKEQLKNLQRVLKPLAVKNPYAHFLELPQSIYNPRRSMNIYLSCMESIAFIHQYQRPLKQEQNGTNYIEITIEDIKHANTLLKDVFIRKSDDASAAARNTLEKIKHFLKENKKDSFYTKDLKDALRLNPNNLKRHLKELEQLNYVKIISGSRYLGFQYKIVSLEEFKQLKQDVEQSLNKQLDKLQKTQAVKA
jgi:DNA-binding MarR family transcriptional regulator